MDSTGLEYLRARYYSPYLNQFIQPDPIVPDYNNPQSINPYTYVRNNPIRYLDPSGMRPNLTGLCVEPPADANNPNAAVIIRTDGIYIYCGEFKLTAYQFVTENGYRNSPVAKGDGRVSISYDFAKDVELEGTGVSANRCPEGYIHEVRVDENPDKKGDYHFSYSCGKGKQFDPTSDYGKVAAADLNVLSLDAQIYIPAMCDTRSTTGSCMNKKYNPYLTVRDEGGSIKGYRLDIFSGQGPGQRATGNTPANLWIFNHSYLGKTITFDHRSAVGPTSVYQLVKQEYQEILLNSIFCDESNHIPGDHGRY